MIDVTEFPYEDHTFRMRIIQDDDYSPSEYTTEDDSPELFAAWYAGDMQYVGLEVTPLVDGDELLGVVASVWGVEYGQCDAWLTSVGTSEIVNEYGPDLAAEALAMAVTLYGEIGKMLSKD